MLLLLLLLLLVMMPLVMVHQVELPLKDNGNQDVAQGIGEGLLKVQYPRHGMVPRDANDHSFRGKVGSEL